MLSGLGLSVLVVLVVNRLYSNLLYKTLVCCVVFFITKLSVPWISLWCILNVSVSSLRWPALRSPWIWTACRCPQSSCHVTTQMVSSLSSTHAASTSLVISLRLVTGDGDQSVISCFSVSCKLANMQLSFYLCVSLIYWSGTEKQPSFERGLYYTTSHIPNLFV